MTSTQASSRVVSNTAWNLFGTGLPLVLALVTVPVLINTIGTVRFGAFTICWTVLSYFNFFDFGVGRATTRFLVGAFENDRDVEARGLFWTALTIAGLVGFACALVTVVLAPLLVNRVLNVPAGLQREVLSAFYILALGIPLATLSQSLTGTLAAQHKFRLLNTLQAPNSALTVAAPLLVLPFSHDLQWLIGALVISRLWASGVFFVAALRSLDGPFHGPFFLREKLRDFVNYSSWQAATQVMGPFYEFTDRFMIGTFSLASVAFYATPAEIINRLLILPQALGRTTFPIFSAGVSLHQRTRVYAKALKHLALILSPVAATIIVFAPDFLRIWVGNTFAQNSTPVLQIMAVGFLANSLAVISFALVQGVGRADITAKFHLVELPIYLLLLWLGVRYLGITGAALAWTARVGLDLLLLTLYAQLTGLLDPQSTAQERLSRILGLTVVPLAMGWLLQALVTSFLLKGAIWGVALGVGAYLVWQKLLTVEERRRVAEYSRGILTFVNGRFATKN